MSFTRSIDRGLSGESMAALPSSPPPQAPATPEQAQAPHRSPQPGDAHGMHTTPTPPAAAPVGDAYGAQLELLLVRQRLSAVVESRRATAAKLRACQRDNAKLHCELQQRSASYDRALAALEQRLSADATAAATVVSALHGDTQRLTAQVRLLELSVAQLEEEAARAAADAAARTDAPPSEADVQLIGALQVEAAALQHEAQVARRARAQAEQSREAVQQQADILRLQVEQMAERLDAEREENTQLKMMLEALARQAA